MSENRWPKPELTEYGRCEMRVCLSTWGSRGDVEPMLGLAVAVRELGGEAAVRATATPADAPRVAADLVAMQFDTVSPAAAGCDALVASGLMPAGERSIAAQHSACPTSAPSRLTYRRTSTRAPHRCT